MTADTNTREIERHCNNYFNPRNDPADPTRDYPPEFLELAARILSFRESMQETPPNIVSESVLGGAHSYTVAVTANGTPAGWQAVFAADLSIYKRAKFL